MTQKVVVHTFDGKVRELDPAVVVGGGFPERLWVTGVLGAEPVVVSEDALQDAGMADPVLRESVRVFSRRNAPTRIVGSGPTAREVAYDLVHYDEVPVPPVKRRRAASPPAPAAPSPPSPPSSRGRRRAP